MSINNEICWLYSEMIKMQWTNSLLRSYNDLG
jgi:hypothetical protein